MKNLQIARVQRLFLVTLISFLGMTSGVFANVMTMSRSGYGCVADGVSLKCWGEMNVRLEKFFESQFVKPRSVAAWMDQICVLDDNGVSCASDLGDAVLISDFKQPRSLEIGDQEICGLDTDGVRCVQKVSGSKFEVNLRIPSTDAKLFTGTYNYWDGFGEVCILSEKSSEVICQDSKYGSRPDIYPIPSSLLPLKNPRIVKKVRKVKCLVDDEALKCWSMSGSSQGEVLVDRALKSTPEVSFHGDEQVCGSDQVGSSSFLSKCWTTPYLSAGGWKLEASSAPPSDSELVEQVLLNAGGNYSKAECSLYRSGKKYSVGCTGAWSDWESGGTYFPYSYSPEKQADIRQINYPMETYNLAIPTVTYSSEVPANTDLGVYDGVSCYRNDQRIFGDGNLQTGTGYYHFSHESLTPPKGRFVPSYWPHFLSNDGNLYYLDGSKREKISGLQDVTDYARVINYDYKYELKSQTCVVSSGQVLCYVQARDYPYPVAFDPSMVRADISDARRIWASATYACAQDGESTVKCWGGTYADPRYLQIPPSWDTGLKITDALISEKFLCVTDDSQWKCLGYGAQDLADRLMAFSKKFGKLKFVAAPAASHNSGRGELCAYGRSGLYCWKNGSSYWSALPSRQFEF